MNVYASTLQLELEKQLRTPSVSAARLREKFLAHQRVDLRQAPLGALAYLSATAPCPFGNRIIYLTSSLAEAQDLSENLRFFLREQSDDAERKVFLYPSFDHSPFLDIAADRQASLDRLSALSAVASGKEAFALVAPISAMLRKMPTQAALLQARQTLHVGQKLDREMFLTRLAQIGYLRVPLVEDPGTVAVRGFVVDFFPAHVRQPIRIELNGNEIETLSVYDAQTQRIINKIASVDVTPVYELLYDAESVDRGLRRIRELCDEVNLPTLAARQLVDDLREGRHFIGVEHYLPLLSQDFSSPIQWMKADACVVVDPSKCLEQIQETVNKAIQQREGRIREKKPTLKFEDFFLDKKELITELQSRKCIVSHTIAVSAEPSMANEDEAWLVHAQPERMIDVGADDNSTLRSLLSAERKAHRTQTALKPFAEIARLWMDAGLIVVLCTRSKLQAQRMLELLRDYQVPVDPKMVAHTELPSALASGTMHLVNGPLCTGFSLRERIYLTEKDIFGTISKERVRAQRKSLKNVVRSLTELKIGDLVVHEHHGVGRYLGLERKTLPYSRADQLRNAPQVEFEVLVIEYAGGNKLFLPITRLNIIQRYRGSQTGQAKLDRLGGRSFATKKARVQRTVKKLADDLLKLYAERRAVSRPPMGSPGKDYHEFEATFPYEETLDQEQAINDVLGDLQRTMPMDRLICGDVGFGKTEVALRTAFLVAMAGKQVAFMCPTTVLAQQHLRTFRERFANYPLRIGGLSRFVSPEEQTKTLAQLKEGKCDIVVGTHRILSKDVHFKNLALLVVDEEQHFGVAHKERLKALRTEVDVLTLSATPIPRTLQLAIGGLRDLSLITTPPIDRRAVRTYVARWNDQTVKEAIEQELGRGGQVFFVYNRIEGLHKRAARLQELVPHARIGVAHGQMREAELERVMSQFVEGALNVLCSTAIVESGLDIPQANTILIDRADAFGLAQLYQLRGRVGRAKERAYCYLFTPAPNEMTDEARIRIEALERFSELGSGFQLASLDMELRGSGEVLGAEQSGSIAAVGFDMFISMLDEAVAELRGESHKKRIDPEIHAAVPYFLPEQYIEDISVRLSVYKRFSDAESVDEIAELSTEMEERFGPLPTQAQYYVRVMELQPQLRALGVLACEAYPERTVLHLSNETSLNPQKVLDLVRANTAQWKLSADMKLTHRGGDTVQDAIALAQETIRILTDLK